MYLLMNGWEILLLNLSEVWVREKTLPYFPERQRTSAEFSSANFVIYFWGEIYGEQVGDISHGERPLVICARQPVKWEILKLPVWHCDSLYVPFGRSRGAVIDGTAKHSTHRILGAYKISITRI